MGFIKDNTNTFEVYLTDLGKEKFFNGGFADSVTFFSVSDSSNNYDIFKPSQNIVLEYDPSKTYPVNSIVEFNNLYYRKVRVGSGDPTNTLIWDEIIVYDSTMIEPQPIPTINHQNTLKTSLGNGLDENIKEVFTQTTLRGKIVDNKTYFKGFFGVKNNTQKDYVMFEPDLSSVDESNIILTYINI